MTPLLIRLALFDYGCIRITPLLQSCLEMLGSLAELSHTSELLSSKATLILSDTTSIVGTGPSPSQGGVASTGEQMVKIYDRLIKTIKKQVRSLRYLE